MSLWVRACLAAASLLLAAAPAARAAESRLALVIGNAAYPAAPLPTTGNDAGLVAQALAQAGFAVTAAGNADRAALAKLFPEFVARVRDAGADATVVVYLAGYGLQYDGDNFLVPVDARIARDAEVPAQAARLSELAQPIEALPARARLFIYDLARRTPFAGAGVPLAPGLAIPATPEGTAVAFNAAPGTVAGPDGVLYGVYARALAEAMQVPNLSAAALLARVRLHVVQRSNGATVPFERGHIDFAFHGLASAPPAVPEGSTSGGQALPAALARDTVPAYADVLAAAPDQRIAGCALALATVRREALLWSESLGVDTARAYWTYMRRYPRGPHLGDARRRLAALHVALEPPPRFDIYDFAVAPPPVSETALLQTRDWSPARACTAVVPAASLLPPAPRDAFATLPPPPIMPYGALPVPFPVAMPSGLTEPGGRVRQATPGGALVSEMRAAVSEMTRDGQVISRLSASTDNRGTTLLQTDAVGAVISRTIMARDNSSIVQTGPKAETLMGVAVRAAPDAGRTMVVTDGKGRQVSSVTVDRDGAIMSVTRDRPAEQGFVLEPGRTAEGLPVVVTSAEARATRLAVPRLPPLLRQPPKAAPAGLPLPVATPAPVVVPPATLPVVTEAFAPPAVGAAPPEKAAVPVAREAVTPVAPSPVPPAPTAPALPTTTPPATIKPIDPVSVPPPVPTPSRPAASPSDRQESRTDGPAVIDRSTPDDARITGATHVAPPVALPSPTQR